MTIDPSTIATSLESAPAWALVALSTRSDRLREDARKELGQHIYSTLFRSIDVETDQLALPL